MAIGAWRRLGRLGLVATCLLSAGGCSEPAPAPQEQPVPSATVPADQARVLVDQAPYQAEVAEGPGAAIVVLFDTSHSMKGYAPGESRPKYVVAREALEAMFAATEKLRERRPELPVRVGLIAFSSDVRVVLPVRDYDPRAVRNALAQMPGPGGGTAIGEAMLVARPELYRSGVYRKYLIVLTDGYNTVGRSPDSVAREIHAKSLGAVRPYFVAFDTDPERFGFLADVGGEVFRADDAQRLVAALDEIYQGRILAEAMEDEGLPPIPRRAEETYP